MTELEKIEKEDLLSYRFLSALSASPDASALLFCVSRMDREENCYKKELWVCDPKTGKAEPLPETKGCGKAVFLKDDSILYNLPEREDKKSIENGEALSVFYELDLKSRERNERFRLPLQNASAEPLSDGMFLVRAKHRKEEREPVSRSGAEKEALRLERKRSQDVVVCDEIPFISDGSGFINGMRNGLYLYSLAEQKLKALVPGTFEVSFTAVSEDKKTIAYSGVDYDRYYVRTHGIYLYHTETGETETLLSPGSFQIMGLAFVGEKLIAAAAPWNGEGSFPNHDLYEASGCGVMRLLYRHADADFGGKGCGDCRYGGMTAKVSAGGRLYYLTTSEAAVYLNSWAPGEDSRRLSGADFHPDSIAMGSDGTVYAIGSEKGLQELYEIGPDGRQKCLTALNAEALCNKQLAEPVPLSFTDRDGFLIHGFVLKPAGYQEGKKYPAVLEIHGGPRAAFTDAFFHEMQCLAARGYFVFFCNPRGSAGGGEAFADIAERRGDPDFRDLMEFTDLVLSKYPDIDEKRLGVMGGSYGGYMTNWIIGHTKRFAAAVSMRSIADVAGSYGATDYGIWGTPGVYGGTPWSHAEKLREQSPVTYAMQVKTPTLFLHSFEDYRCSITGAMQMYAALQIKGVPTRMVLFKGECHELSRAGKPENRLRRLEEIFQWMDRWLLPDTKR